MFVIPAMIEYLRYWEALSDVNSLLIEIISEVRMSKPRIETCVINCDGYHVLDSIISKMVTGFGNNVP